MAGITWCSFLGNGSYARLMSRMSAGRQAGQAPQRILLDEYLALLRHRLATPSGGEAPAPDLERVLEEMGLAGPGREDVRTFRELVQPWAVTSIVGRCAVDDQGHFAVSVYRADRGGDIVRPGDVFFSGAQLSGHVPSGTILVEPHVIRYVCANGAAVPVRADVQVYLRWPGGDVEGNLTTMVELGFSGGPARELVADLRRATLIPISQLSPFAGRNLPRIDESLTHAIGKALGVEERTLYGVYNAMTRVARDTQDVRKAVALERTAGRLVRALVGAREGDPVGVSPLVPA